MGLSDVVTKGNRIVGNSHSLDAVRDLTASYYGFRHFHSPRACVRSWFTSWWLV